MSDEIMWVKNRKAVRLSLTYLATFYLVAVPGLLLIGPAIGAPLALTAVGEALIFVLTMVLYVRTQPWRVGLATTGLHFSWILRKTRYRFDEIDQAVFVVEARQLDRDWPSRLYDLRLRLRGGKERNIGGISGPIARELMKAYLDRNAVLLLYAGARPVGETPLNQSHLA